MKITSIDKSNLSILRGAMQEALDAVGQRYGVKLHLGNATYTSTNSRFKLEVSTMSKNGEVNAREVVAFKNLVHMYGGKPEQLGSIVRYAGATYKVIGLKPESRKYPILVERVSDKKRFKLPEAALTRGF